MSEESQSQGDRSQSDSGGQHGGFVPHPLLVRFAKKSIAPCETIVLAGYLGSPDAKGLVRIYLDLSFCTYLEVQKDRILYVEDADPSDETRPTNIVFFADAPLTLAETVEASFLRGAIATSHALANPLVQAFTNPVARLLLKKDEGIGCSVSGFGRPPNGGGQVQSQPPGKIPIP